jgi:putative flippase GtrA
MPLHLKRELAKYFAAGAVAFLSDFSVFLVLNKGIGVHYLVANLAGFCLGLAVSFIFCIRWVFSRRTYGKIVIEFPVYLIISLATLALGEILLFILVELAAQTPVVAKIIMTGMIFMINFFMKKFILFNGRIADPS